MRSFDETKETALREALARHTSQASSAGEAKGCVEGQAAATLRSEARVQKRSSRRSVTVAA
jgi:hypothetical protein